MIRISLQLPPGERQQLFIDFLNSALRDFRALLSASGNTTEDGGYESVLTHIIEVEGTHIPTRWKITKDHTGMLEELIVEPADETAPNAGWERVVNGVINTAFAATLAERRDTFFYRQFYHYIGPRLDGEYWLPGFRFAPGDPDDNGRYLIHDERVVYVDLQVKGINAHHAGVVAHEAVRRHVARLSLLLNIGLYRPRYGRVWVFPDLNSPDSNSEGRESERRWLGFYQRREIYRMPRKKELSPLGQFGGSVLGSSRVAGYTVRLPREIRPLLRGIEQADPRLREAFDRGARLFHVALVVGDQFPSVSLAYRVAAVEAIAKSLPQPLSFSQFIRSYIRTDERVEKLINHLYSSVRSAHFHAGQFPLGEFAAQRWLDPLMDEATVRSQEVDHEGSALLRLAILYWLADETGTSLTIPTEPVY